MWKWKIRALSEIKNLELFFKKRPNNIIERESSFVKKHLILKSAQNLKITLNKKEPKPHSHSQHPPYLSSRSRIIPFWSCYQKCKNLNPSKDTIVTFPKYHELDFFLTFTKNHYKIALSINTPSRLLLVITNYRFWLPKLGTPTPQHHHERHVISKVKLHILTFYAFFHFWAHHSNPTFNQHIIAIVDVVLNFRPLKNHLLLYNLIKKIYTTTLPLLTL